MTKKIVFLTILIISLTGCSKKSTEPVETEDPNSITIINCQDSFYVSIESDSLTEIFEHSLNFSTDSVEVNLEISEYLSGSGNISILSSDSIEIYRYSLKQNRIYPTVNLIGNYPSRLILTIRDFSGNINFSLDKLFIKSNYDTTGTTQNKDAIYFNSFETSNDISQLDGYGGFNAYYDVPLGGGTRSLRVAGACIAPHVYYEFNPLIEEGEFILQCWGKTIDTGGTVSLRIKNKPRFEGKTIFIRNEEWEFLRTNDTLFCPKDSTLYLEMISGGTAYSSMFVDLVQIVKVK